MRAVEHAERIEECSREEHLRLLLFCVFSAISACSWYRNFHFLSNQTRIVIPTVYAAVNRH